MHMDIPVLLIKDFYADSVMSQWWDWDTQWQELARNVIQELVNKDQVPVYTTVSTTLGFLVNVC